MRDEREWLGGVVGGGAGLILHGVLKKEKLGRNQSTTTRDENMSVNVFLPLTWT